MALVDPGWPRRTGPRGANHPAGVTRVVSRAGRTTGVRNREDPRRPEPEVVLSRQSGRRRAGAPRRRVSERPVPDVTPVGGSAAPPGFHSFTAANPSTGSICATCLRAGPFVDSGAEPTARAPSGLVPGPTLELLPAGTSPRSGDPCDPCDPVPAKLAIPRPGPDLVRRDDLLDRLGRAPGQGAVMLSAPAGYGKTTLVGQWAATDPRPFAYLRLDATDNDPARLLGYLARAVDTLERPPPEQLADRVALADGEPYHPLLAVARLGAVIAGLQTPFVLVVDDAHHLTAAAARALLETVLDHLPSRSHLVVAGRGDSPVAVGRLRGAGRVLQMGPDDLALRPEDVATVCASSGLALDEADLHRLTVRTGGWPVAVRLAVRAGRDRAGSPSSGCGSSSGSGADAISVAPVAWGAPVDNSSGSLPPPAPGPPVGWADQAVERASLAIAEFLREEVLAGLVPGLAGFPPPGVRPAPVVRAGL